MRIISVKPKAALPGGIVQIFLKGLTNTSDVQVSIGEKRASLIAVSESCITIKVPQKPVNGRVEVISSGIEVTGEDITVGRLLATDLHSVANPAVDKEDRIYVTYSGNRGEKVPFSVFVVSKDGSKNPFLAEILNPTGLAVGPDECLYITSRFTGTAYRSTLDKRVEKYADNLGMATGIVFDSKGNLFVGDRGGVIHKVNEEGHVSVFAKLEPSISAYHFVMSDDDYLYVSAPTLSTQDSVYQFDPDGNKKVFLKGLGRPQGMAFSPEGKLQVVASYRGRKGVFTYSGGSFEHFISAPMMVGMAYSKDKSRLFLVDNQSLFVISV